MYVQASYDVVSARYPCGERDCLALAALQLQAENGDAGLVDLNQKLERYLPAKYAESTRTSELANEIRKQHAEHAGKSAKAVEQEYMDYVKEWQVYGSSFFFVEPQMNSEMPEEIFMAVNPKGILLINPDTKEVLATHPYSEVPTWGHSQSSFVLHIGNLIRQTKLYFATEQGKEINDLVRAYVNHLVVAS
jgi:myosin-7